MSQGIKRQKIRKDGSVHVWYRYPVISLWNGEYCPLCLQKSDLMDCHHIVSRSETISSIGYEQHWHNNIINICTLCHEKINKKVSDSLLIIKRQFYYVDAVFGLLTWRNREKLKKFCEDAVKIKIERKNKFSQFEWDCKYLFFDHLHSMNNLLKFMATAHYRASFCREYIEKINNQNTPYFFLDGHEMSIFNGNCYEFLKA